MMMHTIPPVISIHGPSCFNPPTRLHLHQLEEFHFVSGQANFLLYRKEHSRAKDAIIKIPVSASHIFENSSATETLVVDIRLEEQS
jgi:hypothetical protein